MSYRIVQINELIRAETNKLFLTEIDFPRNCLATITEVQTSKDLRHAKILISVLPVMYTRKVVDKLNKSAGRLQFLLKKRLSLKPLPRLNFVIDETEKKAVEIENLLDRIKEEE